jgi:hypothetical protein
VVEGAPLLRAYGSKAHRGFESLPLRQAANQFPPVSITQLWQPRSGDSNPRYGKGGSTKSPKAILDDAHASPEGRGPKARVYPSLSATPYINSRRLGSVDRGSDEARITRTRARPKGARRGAPSNPFLSAIRAIEFTGCTRASGTVDPSTFRRRIENGPYRHEVGRATGILAGIGSREAHLAAPEVANRSIAASEYIEGRIRASPSQALRSEVHIGQGRSRCGPNI